MAHQDFPPDRTKRDNLHLRVSVVADRLLPPFRFAVSWNLPCSTAMLITRRDGMVSYALAVVGFQRLEPLSIAEQQYLIIRFQSCLTTTQTGIVAQLARSGCFM